MTVIKTTATIVLFICLLPILPVRAQTSKESSIHYLTDTTVDFNGLISKFKGKVIYVDIWATWRDVKAFSDFASKNDVVILYICCDKDGKSWKGFINKNQLAGYHILVNSHMEKDFHTTLSQVQMRNGAMKRSLYLPRHIIIDRNGVIADSSADRQGSASVYARLNKMLNN
jgi:hypothetical protein